MSSWFCENCGTLMGGIINPVGICPECGEHMERVSYEKYTEFSSTPFECETVFVDEYKYMVFFDIYDIRWDKHRFHRRAVTLDHEFCEKDYGELENKYTDNTHNTCIIGIVKEPLV
jgi:hypothetical protein